MDSFYSREELANVGFQLYGEDVLVSRKASIYGASQMRLGNHVRIDDFCILSGKIEMGDYVHIAAYCALYGGRNGIELKDFAGISAQSLVYAETDDYLGNALTNPTVPNQFRLLIGGKVTLGRHVLIGAGAIILPDVTIGEGTAVGSMSFINKSLEEWGVYVGCPCRKIKDRNRRLLELEKELKSK